MYGLSTIYEERDLPYGTRHYRKVTEYYFNNERIATLCHQPVSSILKNGTGLLKFDNQIFYKKGYKSFITSILKHYKWEVINISRMDICADFQYFSNNLRPDNLIRKFVKNEIWKIGQAKYQLIGEQGSRHNYEYLKFGSNKSEVSVYLYNKSEEMRIVKMKNYIANGWAEAGYIEEVDTWRLEISLKSNNIKYLNKHTGEIEKCTWDNLLDTSYLVELYNCLINKYLEFRINDGQVRKDRMKRLKLFDNETSRYCVHLENRHNQTVKSDKIFVNKMEQVYSELRENESINEEEIKKFFLKFLEITQLEGYYLKKQEYGSILRDVYLQSIKSKEKSVPLCTSPVK